MHIKYTILHAYKQAYTHTCILNAHRPKRIFIYIMCVSLSFDNQLHLICANIRIDRNDSYQHSSM